MTAATTTISSFCLIDLFSRDCSRLGWVPKGLPEREPFGISKFSRARSPSCHSTSKPWSERYYAP